MRSREKEPSQADLGEWKDWKNQYSDEEKKRKERTRRSKGTDIWIVLKGGWAPSQGEGVGEMRVKGLRTGRGEYNRWRVIRR